MTDSITPESVMDSDVKMFMLIGNADPYFGFGSSDHLLPDFDRKKCGCAWCRFMENGTI